MMRLKVDAAVVRFLGNSENRSHALDAVSARDLWQCLDKSDVRMGGYYSGERHRASVRGICRQ